MNQRAYIKTIFSVFLFLSLFAPTTTVFCSTPQAHPNIHTITFPWIGTFLGINAPHVISSTPKTSDPSAQKPPLNPVDLPSSLEPSVTNPFIIPQTPQIAPGQKTGQSSSSNLANFLNDPSNPITLKAIAITARNTTVDGTPMKITPKTKYRTPPAANTIASLTNISFTQLQNEVKHPPQPLFPNNPQLRAAYEDFMQDMKAMPKFIPLFKKIHITALHQIYMYLTGIYTALNMTHIDDLKTYILTEKKYGLNKKTLIVNHLINIIMAQLNQALSELMPGIPETHAISMGMSCVSSDKLSDPNFFVLDLEKAVLAILGIQAVSTAQTAAAYAALTSPKYKSLIRPSSDLDSAINALNSNSFSAKALNQAQAKALTDALHILIAHFVTEQNATTVENCISYLQGTPAPGSQEPTTQEIAFFTQFVGQCAQDAPLQEAIVRAKNLAPFVTNGDGSAIIPPAQVQHLQEVISFILQKYEQITSDLLSQSIKVLGELNPSNQVLSPTQSLALKQITASMLSTEKPLLLENLTTSQRNQLAYGIWVISLNSANLSKDQSVALQNIASLLSKNPLSRADLTDLQKAALQQALTLAAAYTLQPLSPQQFNENIPKLFNPQQISSLKTVLSDIQKPGFSSFSDLPKDEQVVLLKALQQMDQVIESRLTQHKNQSIALQHIFTGNPAAQDALFKNITNAQYETLNVISDFLTAHNTALTVQKFASLTPIDPANKDNQKAWMSPIDAVRNLFSMPAKGQATSYLAILIKMKNQTITDAALVKTLPSITPAMATQYQAALSTITNPSFSFDQLNEATKKSLISTLKTYQEIVAKEPKAKTYQGEAQLVNVNEDALETIYDVVYYTHNGNDLRNSYLITLKKYLHFFNIYTQELQKPADPAYIGLTQFSNHAKAIQENLAYNAGANGGTDKAIQQTNPPIFFYDKATFKGIRIIPKLAALIHGTEVAPYPSFGIEQAVKGSAINNKTKQTFSNTNKIGSFSYQKFFFLNAADPTNEITGSLPSWITPVSIPNSSGSITTLYVPGSIPDDTITGFYMNIPTFAKNPTNSAMADIRLYEQPVIAQPLWLNNAQTSLQATSPTAQEASVFTILRGCLGDFQSLLNLGIFDPCLTLIFNSALTIPNPKNSNAAPVKTGLDVQKQTAKCTANIAEKQSMVDQQLNTVSTVNNPSITPAASKNAGASIDISALSSGGK